MMYCYPQYFNSKSRFLTYHVVKHALERAGHQVVNTINSCDAVLFSMCDVAEYPQLVKLRKLTNKPIIVGGHYSFNYWSVKLYADAVWIGEVYEFVSCQTLDEVYAHRSCYTGENKALFASQYIDWANVPIGQIAPRKCYYWGGVGCRNKCRFCFTSWTHKHELNSQNRINKAKKLAAAHGLHLMITSNEYDYDKGESGGKTIDMLLTNYLKTPVNASLVRCGIEFATEETRKKMGKKITDNDIYAALQKMQRDNISFRWFYITGYNTIKEYEQHINMLTKMLDKYPNNRMLHLMFNNLQYQNYTPLYKERKQINPDNYIDITVTKHWYDQLRQYSRSVLVGAPSPFQHVACRMGIELSETKQQVDYWLDKFKNAKKKLTVQQAYDALFETKVMECNKREVNLSTGEIKVGKD